MEASRPGPWTGQVLARVIEWQLEHPDGTSSECEEWVKAEKSAGRINVEESSPPASKRGKAGNVSASKKAKR